MEHIGKNKLVHKKHKNIIVNKEKILYIYCSSFTFVWFLSWFTELYIFVNKIN